MRPSVLLACLLFLLFWAPARAAEYFVSPRGSDGSDGSASHPFRTIQKAADVMRAGDTCTIRAGVYRETVRPKRSGEQGRPIRFTAAPGEKVVLSGADVLKVRWARYKGNIFKASTDRKFIQLFVDGRMMNEARWPNARVDRLIRAPRALAKAGTNHDRLTDADLPPGDWNGAIVMIWPGARWISFTRKVANYRQGRQFDFDPPMAKTIGKYSGIDNFAPRQGNPYVLFGKLAALDTPTEWHLEARTRTVYLWTQDGFSPANRLVEVKQRVHAIDLSGLAHVEVRGLRIFSAAVNMTRSRQCLIENCHLLYVDHFRECNGYSTRAGTNVMSGSGNTWTRCSIVYAAGSGIVDSGTSNTITNCIIHDVDYAGLHTGAIDTRATKSVYTRNTLYNSGRVIIKHKGAKGIRIEYNHMFNAGLLTSDCGVTKTGWSDGAGTVIAHNWVHSNRAKLGAGIYLDNFCENFIIHHNLSWNNVGAGIRLNAPCRNTLVANNTLLNNRWAFNVFTHKGYDPDQSTVKIFNNLGNSKMVFSTGKFAPQADRNKSCAVDAKAVPTAGSRAVDRGAEVEGVTEGCRGEAPDIGAYERDAEYWVPGADWSDNGRAPPRTPTEALAAAKRALSVNAPPVAR